MIQRSIAVALIAIMIPLPVAGQRVAARRPAMAGATPSWTSVSQVPGTTRSPFLDSRDSTKRSTPWAVLASAFIPGTGQAILGQDRFVAYLAVEAYAWARYAADAREGHQARTSYRSLASEVARRQFSLVRPVGDFDYYERMEKFVASGAFDAIPGGDLDPEPDTTTANGATWLLARQTYWSNPSDPPPRSSPEYRFAEAFYRSRAVTPDYQWSWANARLEYAEFQRTIRKSNNAYRNSLEDLGLVILNHALSTVDAFITVRLRSHVQGDMKRFDITGSLPLGRRR